MRSQACLSEAHDHPRAITDRRTSRLHAKAELGISGMQTRRTVAPLTPHVGRQHGEETVEVRCGDIVYPRLALAKAHHETRATGRTPDFGHSLIQQPGQERPGGLGQQWRAFRLHASSLLVLASGCVGATAYASSSALFSARLAAYSPP